MNLLVIGGSNSRMLAGYTKWLIQELTSLGKPVKDFKNIALGANTCLLGLVSLCELPSTENYDAIVIEYSVNDYALMASDDLPLWRASYEGLLRQVCRRWPASIVCCVLLGRSNVDPKLWQQQMAETHRVARHYPNVVIADVQATANTLGWQQDRLYSDPMHYSAEMQEYAGRIVANCIAHTPPMRETGLPQPLNEIVFDPVGLLDLGGINPSRTRVFSNSAVQVRALEIKLGEHLSLDIPGAPICVVFVSSLGCGSFKIFCDQQEALVHTLHDGVRDGKHAFLPLSAYGDWWREDKENWRLTFRPVANAQEAADWSVFHVVPSREEQPTIYLSKVLYRLA